MFERRDEQLCPRRTPLRTVPGPKTPILLRCVCAVTASDLGQRCRWTRTEQRTVCTYGRSRRGADPSLCSGASSDLQPAILEPRVRGSASAARRLQDKLSRRAVIFSPRSPAVRAGGGRAGRPVDTFKNCILNYTPPIHSLHRDWLTRAEDISGGPNMTVQCKGWCCECRGREGSRGVAMVSQPTGSDQQPCSAYEYGWTCSLQWKALCAPESQRDGRQKHPGHKEDGEQWTWTHTTAWVFLVFLYFTLFQMNTYKPRELGASRSNRDHTVRHHRVIYREVSSRNMCLCIKYTSTVRSSRRSVGVILERFLQIIITPRSSERVTVGATSTG